MGDRDEGEEKDERQVFTVSGEIAFDPPPDLIGGGTAYIQVVDASRQDVEHEVLANLTIDDIGNKLSSKGTIPFALTGNIETINGRTILVLVHIDLDGDKEVSVGDYITTGFYPVLEGGYKSEVNVVVKKVT